MASVVLDPWQYKLCQEKTPGSVAVGALWLSVGPDLPMIRVTDSEGLATGILLGFPIDLAGRCLIQTSWQMPARSQADPDAFSSDLLRALGGRFLWIQTAGGQNRIYPDCSAQVTCVYDAGARMAGSTAYALLDAKDYDCRFDKASFDRLGIDGEGWFPAGLTAHHGINRLLPNHCLDLDRWEVRRVWPKSRQQTADDLSESVTEIICIIQAQIEALIGQPKKLALALTAGLDTRTMLACARPYLANIDLLTVTGGDRHEVDTITAKRIATELGLSHIALPRLVASEDQQSLYIRRGGHCVGDSNAKFHPSVWPIAKTHIFIGGAGGEIARPPILRDYDTVDTQLTPQFLADRLGLPRTDAIVDALSHHLDSMSFLSALEILDLVYLEDRYAPWYGSQFCCDPVLLRFAPFITTRSVELMMRLPQDWKLTSRLAHAIIERLWPELERYPYNSLGRWKDGIIKLQRVIADPRIVLKKLRKLRS